jgi:hypothetical protein
LLPPTPTTAPTFAVSALAIAPQGAGVNFRWSSTAEICQDECTRTEESGTSLSITAEVQSGFALLDWQGCDTVSGLACRLTVGTDRQVIATITPGSYLVVNWTGRGSVTSSPSRTTSCGPTCIGGYFDIGASVTLTATPGPAQEFAGWDDPACGASPICTVSVTTNGVPTSITATFRPLSVTSG